MGFNPAEAITLSREQSKVPDGLHEEELARLLAELKGYPRMLTEYAVDTGMRWSEIERLEWEDVDVERALITVRETKNDTFRVLPMSGRVRGILEDVKAGQGKLRRRRVFSMHLIRKALMGAAQRAGLPHVHFHLLRHNADFRIMPTKALRFVYASS